MKNFIRGIALVLALLTVVSLFACGKTEEDEKISNSYLSSYSDYEAMEKWLNENINGTDVPPAFFYCGDLTSSELIWVKNIGEEKIHTDFAASDTPVERKCVDITYTCESEKLKIVLTLTSYDDYPVVEYDMRLINESDENSERITALYSINASVSDCGEDIVAHYTEGGEFKTTGYAPHTTVVTSEDVFDISTGGGLPTQGYMPYFNFENPELSNGTIAVLNWQGSWRTKLTIENEKAILKSGTDKSDFQMLPGEDLKLPGMVLLFYKNGDWQYGQNIWRRWIFEHNLMRYTGRRDYIENVFVCSGFPGTETDINGITLFGETDLPEKFNCVVEYDAPWYEEHGNGWYYTGDWSPADQYSGDGLKRVSEACRNAGMKLCFWLEPERVYYGTPQSIILGDNMIYLGPDGRYMTYEECRTSGHNPGVSLINYGKQETVDYVVDLINDTVKTYGLSVYRQDFNTNSSPYWDAYDVYERETYGIPRVGITQIKSCEGYVKAWTAISEANPGLVFDACASGGRRLDLETLRFSFAHTKSDYWDDVISQQGQNFGSLSWIPFTGTGFLDMTSTYDIRSRLTLSIGVGGIEPGADLELLESALDEWQSLHKYMYNDYYQLTEYSLDSSAKLAMQFNDRENGEGMMIGYLRMGGIFSFIARDLDPEKNYKVWDEDNADSVRVMTGAELMSEGFVVAYDVFKPAAVVVWYEETDDEVTPFDKDKFLEGKSDFDLNNLPTQRNDEKELVDLYKKEKIGEKDVLFISPDHNTSGGIYAIGKTIYDNVVLTGEVTSDGWNWVNSDRMYIVFEGGEHYPLSHSTWKNTFDLRAYVKEIDGCYFLWLDNSFGFGDSDGSWKSGTRYLFVEGQKRVKSNGFDFVVCENDNYQGLRDIQFVFADKKNNTVYRLTEEFYKKLKVTDKALNENKYNWFELDYSSLYFKVAHDSNYHNEDGDLGYKNLLLSELNASGALSIYLTEKGGKYYMMFKNASNLSSIGVSDRWELINGDLNNYFHTRFYFEIPGAYRGGVEPTENIEKLW
ncbi:MAG: hypothetical protein E7623_05165 [Ruminococcaceae bacterium]|nr:hypothetical protein [Oscillospiraceae bacterium]